MNVRYDLPLAPPIPNNGFINVNMLPTLLEWHGQDPVDAAEITRNNEIHDYQGNRNPFVDHPEWVNAIYLSSAIPQVATPILSPVSGTFTDLVEVTITCATLGSTIYYTLDGNDPTTGSSEYTLPFTVDATTTVKAMAVKTDWLDSSIAESVITIEEIVVPTGIIISEYIEGSVYNKAVEIYNGTGAEIDLTPYTIRLAYNGSDWSTTCDMQGMLAAEDVFVIASPLAYAMILSVADTTHYICNFNGDDNIGLFYNDILIDMIGFPGFDPGIGWDVAGTSAATANHTLVRKMTVIQGNTDWTASAGTNTEDSEWLVYNTDEFNFLGHHNVGSSNNINAPITNALDISQQPEFIYPDTSVPYEVKAKYFDPDGREDLRYSYLKIIHPEDNDLVMMYYHETAGFGTWAGNDGENYITVNNVESQEIYENGNEGYELTWSYTIYNENWSATDDGISFAVATEDYSGQQSSGNDNQWDIDDSNSNFKQYGITFISHGFTPPPTNPVNGWMQTMGEAIKTRLGDHAVIITYTEDNGFEGYEPNDNNEGEIILIFDWMSDSNENLYGLSEAAADAGFASLMQFSSLENFQHLHLIGHSRGTVIVSEITERLLTYDYPVNHVTYLDPHDWGAQIASENIDICDDYDVNSYLDDIPFPTYQNHNTGVISWSGIERNDTYFQRNGESSLLSFLSLNGRAVQGSYNIQFSENSDVNHSGVVEQYSSSITDLNHQFETTNGTSSDLGYDYSRIGNYKHGKIEHFPNEGSPIDLSQNGYEPLNSIFNGNFEYGYLPESYRCPGWNYHGGDYSSLNASISDYAILSGLSTSITHNRFYIPVNAEKIFFNYRTIGMWESTNDHLAVYLNNNINLGNSWTISNHMSDWSQNSYISIPEYLRGSTATLTLKLIDEPTRDNRLVTSTVRVSNIRFEPTPIPEIPHDIDVVFNDNLTPLLTWNQFNNSDGLSQQGYQIRVRHHSTDQIIYDTGLIDDLSNSHQYSPGSYSGFDDLSGSVRISENLIEGETYHWHVRFLANNGEWSLWANDTEGDYAIFTVPFLSPYFSNPSFSSPAYYNNYQVRINIGDEISSIVDNSEYPKFYYSWNSNTISEEINSGFVVGSLSNTKTIATLVKRNSSNQYTATLNIPESREYDTIYWKVLASDNAGNLGWSDVFSGGVIQDEDTEGPEFSDFADGGDNEPGSYFFTVDITDPSDILSDQQFPYISYMFSNTQPQVINDDNYYGTVHLIYSHDNMYYASVNIPQSKIGSKIFWQVTAMDNDNSPETSVSEVQLGGNIINDIPDIEITSHDNNYISSEQYCNLSGQATDQWGGIVLIEIQQNNGGWQSVWTGSNNDISWSSYVNLVIGANFFEIRAKDYFEDYSTIENISIIYEPSQLATPTDISISVSDNQLVLFWDEIQGANSYKVFSEEVGNNHQIENDVTSFGRFEQNDETIMWITEELNNIQFFKIKASTEIDNNVRIKYRKMKPKK